MLDRRQGAAASTVAACVAVACALQRTHVLRRNGSLVTHTSDAHCRKCRDVAALGCTCRALRAACTDGEVWRALLRRRFPASVLHAAGLGDWRTAYALEANCVLPGAVRWARWEHARVGLAGVASAAWLAAYGGLCLLICAAAQQGPLPTTFPPSASLQCAALQCPAELRCYFSKANFQDEVLGYTLAWTVNPKTRRPDYIAVTAPDLLAAAAYEAGLVRQDPEGNAIMAVGAGALQDVPMILAWYCHVLGYHALPFR